MVMYFGFDNTSILIQTQHIKSVWEACSCNISGCSQQRETKVSTHVGLVPVYPFSQ